VLEICFANRLHHSPLSGVVVLVALVLERAEPEPNVQNVPEICFSNVWCHAHGTVDAGSLELFHVFVCTAFQSFVLLPLYGVLSINALEDRSDLQNVLGTHCSDNECHPAHIGTKIPVIKGQS